MARRAARYRVAVAVGLLLVGCGGDSPTGPPIAPVIELAPGSVSFTGSEGGAGPAVQTVAITNFNSAPLTGLATGQITYGAGGAGWLHASIDKTTAPATLTLTPTIGTLAGGIYTATVPVSSAGASNSPQPVTVNLLVISGTWVTTFATAGQSAVFPDSPKFGARLALQPGAQYLIAVVNTNPTQSLTEDFTLAGALETGASARVVTPPAARAVLRQTRRPMSVAGRTVANLEYMRRLAQNHLTVLELNREIYARLGDPRAVRARLRAPSARVSRLSASVASTVGTVNKIYVRKQLTGTCTAVDSIGARTVAVGQHVIVLADTNRTTWPQGQRPDSAFYQTFADEYDQVTWPHLVSFIGDPLAFDTQLSSTGKVTVTITPLLNKLGGGILAFVNPCDFFPFAATGPDADFSNVTEMFYSLTPATNGFDVPGWEKELRAVAAHETKHIVSIADRILNNSPVLEQVWLEEGLAQESSEIWLRHFNQTTWKGNASFDQTIACEINLGPNAPCDLQDDKPIALALSHLPFLFSYLQGESQSNSEGLGKDNPANYGAGWTIARWATDQYATDEASFIKSLINEPQLEGMANLSSHTGQPIPLLLTYWNLATAIVATPTYVAADVRTTVPSFNFADIFNVGQTGLVCGGTPCGFFTQSGTPVFPIQPAALAPGAINHTVTGVPGTAASFFLLTASSSGTQALQLGSGAGGPISPSSGLRVGIIRVK